MNGNNVRLLFADLLKTPKSDSKSTSPPADQPKPNGNTTVKPKFVNYRQQKLAEKVNTIIKGPKKTVQSEAGESPSNQQQPVTSSLGKRRILPSQGQNNGQKVVLISQPLSVKVPVTKSQGTPTQNGQTVVNSRTNQNVASVTTNQNIGPGKIIYLNSQGQIIGQKARNPVSIPAQNSNQPMRILVQNGDQMTSRISSKQTNQQIKAVQPSIVTSSPVSHPSMNHPAMSQPQAVTIQQQQAAIQQKQAMRNNQQVKNQLTRLNHATPSPRSSPKPVTSSMTSSKMVTNGGGHQQIRPKVAPQGGAITILNGNPQMTRMTPSMTSLPVTSLQIPMTSSSSNPPQIVIPSEMVKIEHDENEKLEPENENGRKLTKDEELLLAELPTMMTSSKSEPKDESKNKSLKVLAKAQMMNSIGYLVRLNLTPEEFNEVIEFSKGQLDKLKKGSN